MCGIIAIALGIDLAQATSREGIELYEHLCESFVSSAPEAIILPTVDLALMSITDDFIVGLDGIGSKVDDVFAQATADTLKKARTVLAL